MKPFVSASVRCAWLIGALLVASNVSAQSQASPTTVAPLSETLTGMAKAEYEAGRILYGDKDYGNAIVKFERAYELSREPRLLWNVAVCQKNLRRYAKMLTSVRRYQKEAGPMLTDDEKAQAEAIVKTVEQFVSALTLTASEPGADVFVDDENVGKTPLAEPVIVDVGVRKIRVSKRGFRDGVVSKEIPGGGQIAIDVRLEKELHRGRIVVAAGAEDIIALDGKVVGRSRFEGVVPSGGHTLRVTASGMATYQSETVVQDNDVRRIEVTLNPLPRDATKTVLWVIGGVVLAGGAAVGGAFLFKQATTPAVQGNISPGTVQLSFGGRR